MPAPHPDSLQSALKACVEPMLIDNPEDPKVFELHGTSYVVKFARKEKGRIWKEWVSAVSCFVLFGTWVRPRKLRTLNIHEEVQRLNTLREAGVNVPQVYVEEPRYFVMQCLGRSLNDYLKEQRDNLTEEQLAWHYQAAIDSLIDLHIRQQWHGGAQLRNITIDDDVIYRIDFEENTGNAMPLALAQTYDVLQCFITLATHTNDILLGTNLLLRYLNATHDANVIKALHKTNCYLVWINKLIWPLLSKKIRTASDVRATRYFSTVLDNALTQYQPPTQ